VRFELRPADTSFVSATRRQFTYDFMVPHGPAAVFRAITEPRLLHLWIPDLERARWLRDGPPGVGSLREVRLAGLTVEERVLVWVPAERFAFHLTATSLPFLRRLVEDFRLTAASGPGRSPATRVQWTIAWQPLAFAGPFERLVRPFVFRRFEEGCRRLAALAPDDGRAGRG
jgi:uncharacterized protein YndB with AHSA1/START domain